MEEKLRHFSAKKRQFGHEIQPLIFDVNIQHIGPYRLSRPWLRNVDTPTLPRLGAGTPLI